MLDHLIVKNFRCLHDLEVPLRPLTVLIGQNDTGKSAFLQAVQLIVTQEGISTTDFWRCDSNNAICIEGRVAGKTIGIQSLPAVSRTGDPTTLERITPVVRFHLPSGGVEMECPGYTGGEEHALDLAFAGQRVAALFDFLLRKDRRRLDLITAALRDLVPGFEDIAIGTPQPAARKIELVIENGLRFPAQSSSVGLRMLLFFVALAYHPRPPRLILLEEPENGVHPKRLQVIIRLLREITEGKHGQHPAQVIITTHSPYLLDQIDVDRDQILIFQRNDDGSRSAEPADADRLRVFLDEFMLGEVWYNQGEEGLVARSPKELTVSNRSLRSQPALRGVANGR